MEILDQQEHRAQYSSQMTKKQVRPTHPWCACIPNRARDKPRARLIAKLNMDSSSKQGRFVYTMEYQQRGSLHVFGSSNGQSEH